MKVRKRLTGLVLLSLGTGMLIVLIIPGWGFLVAAIVVFIGFNMMSC